MEKGLSWINRREEVQKEEPYYRLAEKENDRANMRQLVKRLLKKYHCPPKDMMMWWRW
jgi:hypothetical protein